MVQRIGGFRRKTRFKLQKHPRTKGKISLRRFLQVFKSGDSVVLHAEPAYQKGMYHPRFNGLAGKVLSRCGNCYKVAIKDKNKPKTLIVHPIHLRGSA